MSMRSAGRGRAAARSIRLALRSLSIVATSRASLPRWVFRCRGSRRSSSAAIPRATTSIPPIIPAPPRDGQPPTTSCLHVQRKLMDAKNDQDRLRRLAGGEVLDDVRLRLARGLGMARLAGKADVVVKRLLGLRAVDGDRVVARLL